MNSHPEIFNSLVDLISRYLSTREVSALVSHLIQNTDSTDLYTIKNERVNTKAIFTYQFRSIIDKILTDTEDKFAPGIYVKFLYEMAVFSISIGEYSVASEILYDIVKNKFNQDKQVTANAFLSLSNIESRKANWDASIELCNNSIVLFKEIKISAGLALTENQLGTIYAEKGLPDESVTHFQKGLLLLENLEDADEQRAIIYVNLAIALEMTGKLDESYSNYYRALKIFESLNNFLRIAEIHHNLGIQFTHRKDFKIALDYINKSISLSSQNRFLPTLLFALLSKSYVFTKINEFHFAKEILEFTEKLSYSIDDKLSLAECYKIRGILNIFENNYIEAESNFKTSIRLNKLHKNFFNLAETELEFANYYIKIGNRQEAKTLLENSAKYFRKINNSIYLNLIEEKLEMI